MVPKISVIVKGKNSGGPRDVYAFMRFVFRYLTRNFSNRTDGCAMEVHKELGCGFLEAVSQQALGREFRVQGIPNEAQPVIEILYKGEPLDKKYQPDYVCYGEVIVEIKAIAGLSGVEEAQLINYLKATGLRVGLLINFGGKALEYKRLVYNL